MNNDISPVRNNEESRLNRSQHTNISPEKNSEDSSLDSTVHNSPPRNAKNKGSNFGNS